MSYVVRFGQRPDFPRGPRLIRWRGVTRPRVDALRIRRPGAFRAAEGRTPRMRRRRVTRLSLLAMIAYCAGVWALVIAAVW